MTGIPEVRAQVDVVIETLQGNQMANQEAQFAHNEALSFGESVSTVLEDTGDILAAAKELEAARELGGTAEQVFGKIITGVERGLKAINGVDGHLRAATEGATNTSLRLKNGAIAYAGLHTNVIAARRQADNGSQLARQAANQLDTIRPVEGSPLAVAGQNIRTLADEANAYRNDVIGGAKNTLKIRNGDSSPRLQRIDTELEGIVERLTYASDNSLKNSRQKIESALRLLKEGLSDLASCNARLEAPHEKLSGSHEKITALKADVEKTVTLLGSERAVPQNMARSSAAIQEQAKEAVESI